jgi:methionine-rich copper-binding protein CopC
MMKSISFAITIGLLAFGTPAPFAFPSHARSYLVESYPSHNAHINRPLKAVKLRFSVKADAHFSTIRLNAEDGSILAMKIQSRASRDLDVPVPSLRPGRYRVAYRILSSGGDIVQGKVDFVVDD